MVCGLARRLDRVFPEQRGCQVVSAGINEWKRLLGTHSRRPSGCVSVIFTGLAATHCRTRSEKITDSTPCSPCAPHRLGVPRWRMHGGATHEPPRPPGTGLLVA